MYYQYTITLIIASCTTYTCGMYKLILWDVFVLLFSSLPIQLSWIGQMRSTSSQVLQQLFVYALFNGSEYFRESIRHEIRTARERFSGQALSQELARIQKRLDTVELLTPDIVMNLMLSYRDVQVCRGVCV